MSAPRRGLRRLLLLATAMAGLLGLLATTGAPIATSRTTADQRRIEQAFCNIPDKLIVRTEHGYRPDRSGDIQIVPQEPDFVGHGGLPHSGPWDYVEQVPLDFYGPGYIQARGEVSDVVTLADVAPTEADLLNFDGFHAPDGRSLTEALVPASERQTPPKLIVTVVWDGAGNDVLEAFPNAWPELKALREKGTWFSNAEVGSSPPSTAQIHATIGTGAFTRTHGVIGHQFRIGNRIVTPWQLGPRYLMLPTLGDIYDRAMANQPIVGALATVAIHLGMLGHGTAWGGGDADIAITREQEGAATLGAEGVTWNLTDNVSRFYRFPEYANDLGDMGKYFDATDRLDGKVDRQWFDVPLWDGSVEEAFRTPARIPYQTRLVKEVIKREGFGADDVPDLLYLNFKLIDEIGHSHTMNGPEMRSALHAQDADLPELISFLNRQVGEGNWVMALMADHGHTPDPLVSGARVIEPAAVGQAIQAQFDTDGDDVSIVQFVQPTQIWINKDEMKEQDYTLEEISAFVLDLKLGDVGGTTWPIQPEDAGDPAFIAAFPSSLLQTSDCVPPGSKP